jgi:hypothetical protein
MGQQHRAHRAVRRSRHNRRGSQHRAEPRRTELDGWLIASAIALGVGAAIATGSGQAHADTADTGASASTAHHKSRSLGSAGAGADDSTPGLARVTAPAGSTPKLAAIASAGSRAAVTDTTAHGAHPSASSRFGPTQPAGGHPGNASTAASTLGAEVTSGDLSAAALSTATPPTPHVSSASQSTVPASVAAPSSNTAAKPAAILTIPSGSAKTAVSLLSELVVAVGPASLANPTRPVSPGPLSVVPGLAALVGRDLRHAVTTASAAVSEGPMQTVSGLIDALIGVLGGGTLSPAASSSQASAATTAASTTDTSTTATVPLQVISGTEPVVELSVNGGPKIPVLVDTGSKGLVVPLQDIGFANLGWPTGIGISGYSGGITYLYITFKTKVNFGKGIVTKPTPVDVELLSWPGSFESFAADDGADGVLGVGPNASGPGPSSVITALPGDLSDGVLIDEPDGVLEFGPNPRPARTSVTGAPVTDLKVKIGNGPLESVPAIIDSGGVYGTIPSSISDGVPAGTVISVYADDGHTLLYTYTTDGTNAPDVTSDDLLNTGYEPFAQQPVYISYGPKGVGTTTFDYL